VIGERILRRTPQLGHLAPVVRHEHERWDGNGYPDGLAGTEIPIASRIILACDAYNAMITTRPYREAMSAEDAVAELRDKSGTQFDPQVVAALLKRLRLRLRVPALSPSSSAVSAS
jgi:HD-GYP domain-containing protein (c-di-GMP phosphodiesterase class II)